VKRSVVLIVIVVGLASSTLLAQQARHPRASVPSAMFVPPRSATLLASVPDSIRRKRGYQHWKGGAIRLGLGALGGLVLAWEARSASWLASPHLDIAGYLLRPNDGAVRHAAARPGPAADERGWGICS
jgi:hypothetical protein